MNKKLIVKLSALSLCVLFAVSSCKKSSSSSSEHDNFVGKWKLHQLVQDANGNGVQDATDPISIEDSLMLYITFNSNGSATSTSIFGPGTPLTWSLSTGNTYLVTVDSGSTAANGLQIVTAPGSTFVVKDTTGGTTNWETFVKQ